MQGHYVRGREPAGLRPLDIVRQPVALEGEQGASDLADLLEGEVPRAATYALAVNDTVTKNLARAVVAKKPES